MSLLTPVIFLIVECSCPYKERCNWRKIDTKGVGPDEESKRSDSSPRWERLIPATFASHRFSPSLPPFRPSFVPFHVFLPYRARLSTKPRGIIRSPFSPSPRGSGFVVQVVLTYLSGSSFLCLYENFPLYHIVSQPSWISYSIAMVYITYRVCARHIRVNLREEG